MRREIIEFFIIKQIKKTRLVLCSVVKHLGSGRALQKWGKTLNCISCFPLHFFCAVPLPACSTTEHRQSRLLYLLIMNRLPKLYCYINIIFIIIQYLFTVIKSFPKLYCYIMILLHGVVELVKNIINCNRCM